MGHEPSLRRRGNCYVCAEALFWLLGGKKAGYKPMVMRHEGDTHWFLLQNPNHGYSAYTVVVDPTARQFKTKPDYSKARGCGFLTKGPSKKARKLIGEMLWQR